MTTQELVAIVGRATPGETWVNSLETRKKAELEFHDRHRDYDALQKLETKERDALRGNKKYYLAAGDGDAFVRRWIAENCPGKVVLDLACGDGILSLRAAAEGAALCIGIDLSTVSVQNANIQAQEQGLSARAIFLQGDAEHTVLPDESVDVVLCSGVLHHFDLSYAFPEIRRVLKHGGVVLAYEALAYNPLIRLYRMLTPLMRTDWEKHHILSMADLRFARRFFKVRNVRHWTLVSLFGVFCKPFLPALQKIDRVVLRLPLVRNLSWSFTFELVRE